jgi:hypothetical protein
MKTLSAIPIRAPYIDEIVAGTKTWEIRSKFTKKIGPVGLIRSKSGTVVGIANLIKVVEITASIGRANARKMGMSPSEGADCEGLFAWVLEDVVKFKTPVPYKHPSGAVTWVTLDELTTKKVLDEAKRSRK